MCCFNNSHFIQTDCRATHSSSEWHSSQHPHPLFSVSAHTAAVCSHTSVHQDTTVACRCRRTGFFCVALQPSADESTGGRTEVFWGMVHCFTHLFYKKQTKTKRVPASEHVDQLLHSLSAEHLQFEGIKCIWKCLFLFGWFYPAIKMVSELWTSQIFITHTTQHMTWKPPTH